MSPFRALQWAGSMRVGGPSGKLVLLNLAGYADENGSCFPSQERIARETELSIRSVQTWLKKLEEMGLLSRIRDKKKDGTWGLTRYHLNLDISHPKSTADPHENSAGGPQDVVSPHANSAPGHHTQLTTSPHATDDVTTRNCCGSELPRELDDDDSAGCVDQGLGSDCSPDVGQQPDANLDRTRAVVSQVLDCSGLHTPEANFHGAVGIVNQWLANGWDAELDILPTVPIVLKRATGPIHSLSYFSKAIGQAHAQRLAAKANPDDPAYVPKKGGYQKFESELQAERTMSAIEEVFGGDDDDSND